MAWPAIRLEPEPVSDGGYAQLVLAPPAVAQGRPASGRVVRAALLRRALLVGDVVALNLVLVLGQLAGALHAGALSLGSHAVIVAIALPLWLVLAAAHDAYGAATWRPDHGMVEELGRMLQLTTMWSWGVLSIVWALGLVDAVDVGAVLSLWLAAVAAVLASRSAARAWCRRRLWYWQNVLVVGRMEDAAPAVRRMIRNPAFGMHVVACVDATVRGRFAPDAKRWIDHVPVVAESPTIPEIVRTIGVDRVVLAGSLPTRSEEAILRDLADLAVDVDILPPFAERFGRADIHHVAGVPTWTVGTPQLPRHALIVKRTLDVLVSAVALAALAPVLAACAIAIKLDSPGPIFFRQRRVGKDAKPFRVFKFRSMYIDADRRKAEVAALNFHGGGNDTGMFKIREDPRISRVGRWLRRSSLDELPQLINVLRGEMSLVGPRPLIENEDRQIEGPYHRRRISVRPGLTGPWQVHGRSEIPFDEMVKLDCLYATSWSPKSDVKLLMRTAAAVLHGRGAY